MDIIVAMGLFLLAMFVCVTQGIPMPYGLLFGLCGFVAVALKRGFTGKEIWKMGMGSFVKGLPMARLFLLIGMITGLWRACGTIAYFIYWGVRLITPHMFLVTAFLTNCLLSYALGTSMGVSGTMGVIFMALARSGGVDPAIAAGVVMSGVYFGDRCSPSSSCANVVAAATDTDIISNVRLMLKTGALPFALTLGIYIALSFANPILEVDANLTAVLTDSFKMVAWAALPAAIMVLLPLLGVAVWKTMAICAASSAVIAFFLQGMQPLEILRLCALGFHPENELLARAMGGGGIVSMLQFMVLVLISSVYSGIFDGTGMLNGTRGLVDKLAARMGRFPGMALSSIAVIAMFCNQVISVLMQVNLWTDAYPKDARGRSELALDIYNSTVTMSGLVPWCVACYGVMAILGEGVEILPYACLLYLTPVCYLFTKRYFFKEK